MNVYTCYHYTIRIHGSLDQRWLDWFDGMSICYLQPGETSLSGWVTDQAALFGYLMRIRDLGLPLISVTYDQQLEAGESIEAGEMEKRDRCAAH